MKSSDQTNNGRMQLCRTGSATAVGEEQGNSNPAHGWERQPLARESRAAPDGIDGGQKLSASLGP